MKPNWIDYRAKFRGRYGTCWAFQLSKVILVRCNQIKLSEVKNIEAGRIPAEHFRNVPTLSAYRHPAINLMVTT
jgi:hypothetical protein